MSTKANVNTISIPDYWNQNHYEDTVELVFGKLKTLVRIDDTSWGDATNTSSEDQVVIEYRDGFFYFFAGNPLNWKEGTTFSSFGLLQFLKFKGNISHTVNWIKLKYTNCEDWGFVQVGPDYYATIELPDAYNIDRVSLRKWTRTEVKRRLGSEEHMTALNFYYDFSAKPSYIDYEQPFRGCYNQFDPLAHKIKKGKCDSILALIKHVFGEHYLLGLKYLKRGIERPDLPAHVLLLLSEEEGTGKTTFLKFMKILHGRNMIIASPAMLENTHNDWLIGKVFIGFEETEEYDKKIMQKIKSITTSNEMLINPKGTGAFESRIYTKMIFTSNNEDSPLMIEKNDTRHWPLKIPVVQGEKKVRILDTYMKEMPAFIAYLLDEVEEIDYENEPDRLGFRRPESQTLTKIQSHSGDKWDEDFLQAWEDFLGENTTTKTFFFRATDVMKYFWQLNGNRYKSAYIAKRLKLLGFKIFRDESLSNPERTTQDCNFPEVPYKYAPMRATGKWYSFENPYFKGMEVVKDNLDRDAQEFLDSLDEEKLAF